eukprot:TRINITY_DN5702_c0_g1_i1.p3 TRINITY_DN5702_c0_g1~~TRINITY_DN5702_c0_g1_i1.p3  ORF type:complete len:102 (+),score=9.65 TRINITY_DN5702_c0_g1_i1:158-463(+)
MSFSCVCRKSSVVMCFHHSPPPMPSSSFTLLLLSMDLGAPMRKLPSRSVNAAAPCRRTLWHQGRQVLPKLRRAVIDTFSVVESLARHLEQEQEELDGCRHQ